MDKIGMGQWYNKRVTREINSPTMLKTFFANTPITLPAVLSMVQ